MPKNKAKGGRQGKGKGGTSGAERRAIARDLPALKAITESCDTLREEWRASGGDVWEDHKDDCLYYTKMRRRKCVVCGRDAKYSDPPFPVCACGERCYCGEGCQALDWVGGTARSRPHSETCASGYLHLAPRSPSTTPPQTPSTTTFPSDWEDSEGS